MKIFRICFCQQGFTTKAYASKLYLFTWGKKATKKVVHLSTSTPEKTRVCAYWREGVNQGNILNTQIQMYCIF